MEDAVKHAVLAAFLGAGLSVAAVAPLSAHHSAAAYDRDADIELAGTIKEMQYTNPHSWLIVEVGDKAGKTVDWGFEAEGPSTLLRAGIKASSLKPGEKVTVKGHPLRDAPGGAARERDEGRRLGARHQRARGGGAGQGARPAAAP